MDEASRRLEKFGPNAVPDTALHPVAFPRIASTAIRLPSTSAPPLENPTD